MGDAIVLDWPCMYATLWSLFILAERRLSGGSGLPLIACGLLAPLSPSSNFRTL